MKIIIASMPVGGHLNPLLGMASFLAKAGQEIRVYTGTTMRDRVIDLGLGFHPLPREIDFDFADIDGTFPERALAAPGPDRARFDFERIFLGAMEQQYRGLEALLGHFPADAIIAEALFYGAVPLKLKRGERSPRVISCGITPSLLPRADYAPFGPALPFADDPETRRLYRDEIAPAAALQQAPIQALFDAELRRLGVDGAPCGFLDATRHVSDAFLQSGVPGLDYPTGPLPDDFHYLGLPLQAAGSVEKPDWAGDIERFRRVVLVTQGTVANASLDSLVLPTLRALADEPDTLVIATGGGRDTLALRAELPANARIADYLPFDWLMPRLDVMVTNGGYGTVLQALAAGVPIVTAGTTEDKSEVSARVAYSGAGIDLKTDTPSELQLADAVSRISQNPAYARRARRLAESFALYDGRDILSRVLGLRSEGVTVRGGLRRAG